MKNLLYILLLTPIFGFGQEQEWNQSFGGDERDEGRSVQQTLDGGYIIVGKTKSFGAGDQDLYLLKTDAEGEELWSYTFGGIKPESGSAIEHTADGGYIIFGTTTFNNGSDNNNYSRAWLIKIDEYGQEQWSQTLGGILSNDDNTNEVYIIGKSGQQTSDGGYIIGGTREINSGDYYLIKTDGNGQEQWSQNYGGDNAEEGYYVRQTFDGGYIMTGYSYSYDDQMLLVKTDENGYEQWSRTFGGYDASGHSAQQTSDGGYIIIGGLYSIENGCYNACLIKTNQNGIEQWSKTFGGDNTAWAKSGQQTSDGGYIISGGILDIFGNYDIYLIKTDINGEEEWSLTVGGEATHEISESVLQTIDGGFIITGYVEYENGDANVYLVKIEGDGNITSTTEIDYNPNKTLLKTIDILGRETEDKPFTPLIDLYDDGTTQKRIIIE